MSWGPGAAGGFQNALSLGMQVGQIARQNQDAREYKNALAGFDPSKPETLEPIMRANPEVGLQLRGQVEQRQADARIAQLGQEALNGNNEALGQLFTLKPDLWKNLDDRQREGVKTSTSYMAQRALQIGRLPEEQRAAAWAASVQEAERGGMDIPAYLEAYTPGVLDSVVARAGITEKYIQQFEPDFRVIPQGGYLEDVNPVTAGQQQPATQQGPRAASRPVAKQVGGATYYQNPETGKWYDNPQEAMGGGGSNVTGTFQGS